MVDEIKPELLLAVRNDGIVFFSGNVAATKCLRMFVGRAAHVSYLNMFWTLSSLNCGRFYREGTPHRGTAKRCLDLADTQCVAMNVAVC